MSSDIVHLVTNHPLVGIWTGEEDDARAEYTINQEKGIFVITARDRYDGEIFEITNIKWDGKILSFDSYMASTGREGKNTFTVLDNNRIAVEYTFTDKAVFVRKN